MNIVISAPSPKQMEFLRAKTKYVAYGGARGGGKSWSVQTKCVLMALKHAGIRQLIVRRTYPELINNHVNTLRAQLRECSRYNDRDKCIVLNNGSRIDFQYCAKDADLDRLQGVEYDIIYLDEATQLSEWQMKTITACVRGVNDFPKRVYYTCNPGGQGHAYIKRLFVDRKFQEEEDPNDYTFIQALVTDNKALMTANPEYVKQLEALPPKLRDAWRYGSWDVYEGQFFEEFLDEPKHYADRVHTHVIDPFEIPDGWLIYRSFDWGYAKPFSCGWWAVDYDGVLYRIFELYGCRDKMPNEGVKWTPEHVFNEIHRIETEHRWLKNRTIHGVADPAIWNSETGKSIAEVAAECGVYFQKGDHQRLPGWMQVHYRMAFDRNGFPMMYIFKTCKAFIRTIPLLMYDEHKAEDLDTDGEDHVADEVRYMCMARPIKPMHSAPTDDYSGNPMFQYLDIDKKDLSPATHHRRMEIIE